MHPDWARSIRDQCEEAGVPFFFKQWGDWISSHDLDEADHLDIQQRSDPDLYFEEFRFESEKGDSTSFGICCYRVGKKRAGRLLDGKEHNYR